MGCIYISWPRQTKRQLSSAKGATRSPEAWVRERKRCWQRAPQLRQAGSLASRERVHFRHRLLG